MASTFGVAPGEIVSMIGANGAGKTSTLLAISGVQRASGGSIDFDGERDQPLAGAPDRRSRRRSCAGGSPHLSAHDRVGEPGDGHLRQPRIPERGRSRARASRSFRCCGNRIRAARRHAVGRRAADAGDGAGAGRPGRCFLLDEPSMGLAPQLVELVFDAHRARSTAPASAFCWSSRTPKWRCTIADRAYVLESGRIRLSGDGGRLLDNPEIQAAYLGG